MLLSQLFGDGPRPAVVGPDAHALLFSHLCFITLPVKKVLQIAVEQNAESWLVRRSVFMIHLTLTGLARTLPRESVLLQPSGMRWVSNASLPSVLASISILPRVV